MQFDYLNFVVEQFKHAQFCSANSFNLLVCHDFWMWSLFIVEAAALLIFVPIIYREYQTYRGRKSYLKWLAEYERIADPDVMAKMSWQGHAYVTGDLSQKELAEQIRLELEKRRDNL